MKVNQIVSYSVELTEDERATLANAAEIIGDLLDAMMDNKCSQVVCKYINHSYAELDVVFHHLQDVVFAVEIKS